MTAIRTVCTTIGTRLSRVACSLLVATALLLADLPLALAHNSPISPESIPAAAANVAAPTADAVVAQPYDPEALPRNPSLQPRLDKLQEKAERDSSLDRGAPDPDAIGTRLSVPPPLTEAEAVPFPPARAECRPCRRAYDPLGPPLLAI